MSSRPISLPALSQLLSNHRLPASIKIKPSNNAHATKVTDSDSALDEIPAEIRFVRRDYNDIAQDVLSNLEPLVTSLPHQIKQRLVNVLQAETDKVDGWGVPIEGEAGIQTIIDSSLAQPVNILLRTLIPLAGENVLYWRCSCSNVGGAKPDLILVWRFHDEGMGVIREVVLAVMEIKTTNVMSATSANRISSAINTAGSVKYSDSTVVSNSTPLNNDERNIIEQMTAEITSRHVSCGILTNYETFSLFHHPEDRCDEIFVHALTTSDGRSQPDAVIGSPLGFMLAVTLLVVRDRGLEWDLGLVEEEEEVERGDDRPGVGRGQGPGDVMDRHGAGGSGSSGAPVLGSWVDRHGWTFNPRTGDPGSERPMGRPLGYRHTHNHPKRSISTAQPGVASPPPLSKDPSPPEPLALVSSHPKTKPRGRRPEPIELRGNKVTGLLTPEKSPNGPAFELGKNEIRLDASQPGLFKDTYHPLGHLSFTEPFHGSVYTSLAESLNSPPPNVNFPPPNVTNSASYRDGINSDVVPTITMDTVNDSEGVVSNAVSTRSTGPSSALADNSTLKLTSHRGYGSLWETFSALTPDNHSTLPLIAKLTSLSTFPERPTSDRSVLSRPKAERDIAHETRLMLGPLQPLQGTVVPLFFGLYGGVQSPRPQDLRLLDAVQLPRLRHSGAGKEMCCVAVYEDAGWVMPEEETRVPGVRHTIVSLYSRLHAHGIVHNDVEWRHILAPIQKVRNAAPANGFRIARSASDLGTVQVRSMSDAGRRAVVGGRQVGMKLRLPIELDRIRLVDFGRAKARYGADGEEIHEEEEWRVICRREMEGVEEMLRG